MLPLFIEIISVCVFLVIIIVVNLVYHCIFLPLLKAIIWLTHLLFSGLERNNSSYEALIMAHNANIQRCHVYY